MEQNSPKEKRAKVQSAGDTDTKKPIDDIGEKKPTAGIVTDCLKLNLRERPDSDAAVLAVIPALTEVAVDMEASTDSFYKVCTAAGIEGFCMRKYIAIRK